MPRPAPYGYVRSVQYINIPQVGFLASTAAVNRVLSKSIGFQGELEKVEIIPTIVGTGGGASRVINIRKGSATGTIVGTVTAALADGATLGVVKVGTVTAGVGVATFLDGDTLTIELPSGGTAFTAGSFDLVLTFRSRAQRAA